MKEIEEKVLKDGQIIGKDIIKVDCLETAKVAIFHTASYNLEINAL